MKVLRDNVLIERIVDRQTPGGIVIPEQVQNKEEGIGLGRIVAVGSGHVTDTGDIIPLEVSVGDTVRFKLEYSRSSGQENIFVAREADIVVVVD